MVKRASRRLRFAATTSGLIALGAIVVALAGCGGGGGGGGSTPVYSVNGIVESSTGSPVAGDTVRFDNYSALSATTNSAGKFALQVPAYDVSGADVIYVYDSTGSEVGADTVTTSTISSPVVKLDEASSNTTGSSSSSSSDSPPAPPTLTGGTGSSTGSTGSSSSGTGSSSSTGSTGSSSSGSSSGPPSPPVLG